MNKKIMIIDDEPAVGEMMTTLLESEGYEAMVAYDGPGGLEQMGKKAADLLLLDRKVQRDRRGLQAFRHPKTSGADSCGGMNSRRYSINDDL